jgi:hypothetical protein
LKRKVFVECARNNAKKWPGVYIFNIVIRKSRCTVDMLNQKMKIKTQDVGKIYEPS